MYNFNKIKIVIWDLDETFWNGTLSEGSIEPIYENINLVRRLTDCGIINSICSKNDFQPTIEALSSISEGLLDLFVLPSINWQPKGPRIEKILKSIGLRAENCLFIDDNVHNLEDARYTNKGIMTALPNEIESLTKDAYNAQTSDKTHRRLKQYKVLENKIKAAQEFSDNTEFLFSSNIQVAIFRDCENQFERIVELVQRTNQLNFTKRRDSGESIKSLIDDPTCDTGYVKVQDKFGDYGIVGFFAVKNNKCIHLLFSCRTIGQGVEEFVYSALGYPVLETVEPVINHLGHTPSPAWINQNRSQTSNHTKHRVKIVFKGACDLKQMCEYLDSSNIIEEFTYIGKERNNYIEHHNHSINYLTWRKLNDIQRQKLVEKLVFNDVDMFKTSLFDENVSLIVLSTMIEPHLGIYRHKESGNKLAFGDALHPLTDKSEWKNYKNGTLPQGSKYITDEWLEWFCNQFEFCGTLSPNEIIENAKLLLDIVGKNVKICYLLGPEINKENETDPTYIGREKIYAQVNKKIRLLSQANSRVLILDPNKWIHKPSDFTNNLNHWNRRIYYELAKDANKYIEACIGENVGRKSGKLNLIKHLIRDRISSTGFFQTPVWSIISNIIRK